MYDVVFLHPPSVMRYPLIQRLKLRLRFRKPKVTQFLIMPMGLISMASLLEDNGFSTRIFNLGLEKILSPEQDFVKILKGIESKIFAIDLHWYVHSDGAIEVAKICKKLNPNSRVILGGLTASIFDLEIMRNYPFVDIIIRGEGENVILETCKKLSTDGELSDIKGLTYRENERIRRNPPAHISDSIDDFDFTRIDLIEHANEYLRCSLSTYFPKKFPAYWLTIGRGCPYKCIYCGGGSESYKRVMGRNKFTFRNPTKVVEDISYLRSKGVRIIRFGQDLELGGRKYYHRIFNLIKKERLDVGVYNESWCRIPSIDFINSIKGTFPVYSRNIVISPDSASDAVRRRANRAGTNKQILKILSTLDSKRVITDVYFLIGLPGETVESVKDILRLANRISKMKWVWVAPPFPFTIDPYSPIAIRPEAYGVELLFKTFKDYKDAFRSHNVADWIGHETKSMTRKEIAEVTENCYQYVSRLNQPGVSKKLLFEGLSKEEILETLSVDHTTKYS